MTESTINLLNKTGLTDGEAKVYLALLQNGGSSGYEASKQAGVPRSKIYNLLESLVTTVSYTHLTLPTIRLV